MSSTTKDSLEMLASWSSLHKERQSESNNEQQTITTNNEAANNYTSRQVRSENRNKLRNCDYKFEK